VIGGATFSTDGRYRYRLWRRWDRSGPVVAFVMLNPSTADAFHDDPTIRRCIGFARSWGFGGIEVVNLFALRATDPRKLQRARDPVGRLNDDAIRRATGRARMVIAAWGLRGRDRAKRTRRLIGHEVYVLRLTQAGHPTHPLYLPKNLCPRQWPGMGVGKRSLPRV